MNDFSVIKSELADFLEILKARKKNEGETWTQPSGRRVTKKNGKIVPVKGGSEKKKEEPKKKESKATPPKTTSVSEVEKERDLVYNALKKAPKGEAGKLREKLIELNKKIESIKAGVLDKPKQVKEEKQETSKQASNGGIVNSEKEIKDLNKILNSELMEQMSEYINGTIDSSRSIGYDAKNPPIKDLKSSNSSVIENLKNGKYSDKIMTGIKNQIGLHLARVKAGLYLDKKSSRGLGYAGGDAVFYGADYARKKHDKLDQYEKLKYDLKNNRIDSYSDIYKKNEVFKHVLEESIRSALFEKHPYNNPKLFDNWEKGEGLNADSELTNTLINFAR